MKTIGGIAIAVATCIALSGCDVVGAVAEYKDASDNLDSAFETCANEVFKLPESQGASRDRVEVVIGTCMNEVAKELKYPLECDAEGMCSVDAPGGSMSSSLDSMLNSYLAEHPSITLKP